MSTTGDVRGDVRGDGSALADAPDRVEIDRSDHVERYRWRCPNGHIDWDRTNNHIWCRGCLRQHEAGEDVDPEHYAVVDAKTGEEISWSAVEVLD